MSIDMPAVRINFGGGEYSLLERVFTPTFYQFVDTIIEVKVSVSITRETTASYSSTDVDSSLSLGGNLITGFTAGLKVSTVSASFASKYQYSAEGSSLLRTKLVPVPPPAILQERMRRLAEVGLQQMSRSGDPGRRATKLMPTSPGRICWQRKRKPRPPPQARSTHARTNRRPTLVGRRADHTAARCRSVAGRERSPGVGAQAPFRSGDPRPEDERIKRMYPVKVHTKDSRIEERRLRRHDDHQRLLNNAHWRRSSPQHAKSADRLNWQPSAVVERWNGHSPGSEPRCAERKPRPNGVVERSSGPGDVHEQARQAEYAAEQERKALEAASVRKRWEHGRQKALHKRAQERRQEALWQERVLENSALGHFSSRV